MFAMGNDRVDVVVVEDEPSLLSAVADLFLEEGYRTRAFARPEPALETIVEKRPRLVVIDQELAGMFGHELKQRVCERLGDRAPRFLLLTPPSAPRAVRAGFDAVLHKPFRLDELLGHARALGLRQGGSGVHCRADPSDDDGEETG